MGVAPFLNSGRTSLSPAAFAIPKPDAFGDRSRGEIRTWLQNFTAFSFEQVDRRRRPRMKSIAAPTVTGHVIVALFKPASRAACQSVFAFSNDTSK